MTPFDRSSRLDPKLAFAPFLPEGGHDGLVVEDLVQQTFLQVQHRARGTFAPPNCRPSVGFLHRPLLVIDHLRYGGAVASSTRQFRRGGGSRGSPKLVSWSKGLAIRAPGGVRPPSGVTPRTASS